MTTLIQQTILNLHTYVCLDNSKRKKLFVYAKYLHRIRLLLLLLIQKKLLLVLGGPAQYSAIFQTGPVTTKPGDKMHIGEKIPKKLFFSPWGPVSGPSIHFSYLGFPSPVLGNSKQVGPRYDHSGHISSPKYILYG